MNRERLVKALTYFYIVPLTLMLWFNTGNSLLRTTYFELYSDMETAKYRWDRPLLVLGGTVVFLVLLYFLFRSRAFAHCSDRLWMGISLAVTAVLSLAIVLLFRAGATNDSGHLSRIAIQFMQGNYDAFRQGEYLYQYPFQIGLAALLELIYHLFGIECFLVFQLLNILAILVFLLLLHCITRELFFDERIAKLEAVFSACSLPLMLFSTFIYGDLIGWAFGAGAIYATLRYLKTDRWTELLKSAVLLMLGVIVKSNINIVMIAILIAILLHAIAEKKYWAVLFLPVILLISQAGIKGIELYYTHRAGLAEFPRGIPKIAWVAMSFQETDEGGYAPGWYNAYSWAVYTENGYDRAATTAACMENLKQSLHKLLHEQRYALNFFYKKFTSAWNAPTFQAMITNEWATRHVEGLSDTALYFLYGTGRAILYELMNLWHFFVFFTASVAMLSERKKWTLAKAVFVLVIFGGFLFHMVWETQARYILGYFTLILPLSACGCVDLFDRMTRNRVIRYNSAASH